MGNHESASVVTQNAQTHIDMSARLLEVAEYNTILDQFGKLIAEYKTRSEYHEKPLRANQRQADEGMLRTLAGFFAGEGHIGIRKQSKKSQSPSLIIEVGNTEIVWCQLFQTHFGGYIRIYYPKRYKDSLPYYHWTVKDTDAAIFLQEISPFLIGEKRPQAELGLRLATIKLLRPFSGGRFSNDQLEVMERLEHKLRDLRRAAAETKRTSAMPMRSDSPTLSVMAD